MHFLPKLRLALEVFGVCSRVCHQSSVIRCDLLPTRRFLSSQSMCKELKDGLTGVGTSDGTAGNDRRLPLPRDNKPGPPGSVVYPSSFRFIARNPLSLESTGEEGPEKYPLSCRSLASKNSAGGVAGSVPRGD